MSREANKETLAKAIQKATDNGLDETLAGSLKDEAYLHPNQLIFNHDFAKALWGEEAKFEDLPAWDDKSDYYPSSGYKMWEYHLQNMVIAEDPIKYLGENI